MYPQHEHHPPASHFWYPSWLTHQYCRIHIQGTVLCLNHSPRLPEQWYRRLSCAEEKRQSEKVRVQDLTRKGHVDDVAKTHRKNSSALHTFCKKEKEMYTSIVVTPSTAKVTATVCVCDRCPRRRATQSLVPKPGHSRCMFYTLCTLL